MSCVFCDIVSGRASAVVIHRTDRAIAFLPNGGALAPGHCLVAPLAHAVDLFDVSGPDLEATMLLVKRLSVAMRTTLEAGGVNVLNASGPHSEQSVLHLHFHVVPRWEGDGFTTWPSATSNVVPADDLVGRLTRWFDV
jgi:histidine triad (HIT) family protein